MCCAWCHSLAHDVGLKRWISGAMPTVGNTYTVIHVHYITKSEILRLLEDEKVRFGRKRWVVSGDDGEFIMVNQGIRKLEEHEMRFWSCIRTDGAIRTFGMSSDVPQNEDGSIKADEIESRSDILKAFGSFSSRGEASLVAKQWYIKYWGKAEWAVKVAIKELGL